MSSSLDKTKVYVGCPYTSKDPKEVEDRVRCATKLAAYMMSKGHVVFSPLTHSHTIADFLPPEDRFSQEFWMGQDLPMLEECDVLLVLRLPGWEESRGLRTEMQEAQRLGKYILWVDPGKNWDLVRTNTPWQELPTEGEGQDDSTVG